MKNKASFFLGRNFTIINFDLGNTYVFTLPANKIHSGVKVGSVVAKDADQGPNGEVSYQLKQDTEEANIFKVNEKTGEISISTSQQLKQKR